MNNGNDQKPKYAQGTWGRWAFYTLSGTNWRFLDKNEPNFAENKANCTSSGINVKVFICVNGHILTFKQLEVISVSIQKCILKETDYRYFFDII